MPQELIALLCCVVVQDCVTRGRQSLREGERQRREDILWIASACVFPEKANPGRSCRSWDSQSSKGQWQPCC